MKLRRHYLVLLLVSSLAAIVLVALVSTSQSRLNEHMYVVGNNEVALRDLAQLEDAVGQFLLTTDIVIGAGESYLAAGADRQAEMVARLLLGITQDPLFASAANDLAAFQFSLESIRDDIEMSATRLDGEEDREAMLSALSRSVDNSGAVLVNALATARSAAQEADAADRAELHRQAMALEWITWLGSGLYILLVAVLWWWTTRIISGLESDVSARTEQLSNKNQELSAAVEDAEQARKSAEFANQAKSEFLARMSHEIRTPLNGVLGVAELLQHQELEVKSREYVSTISQSGQELLALIDDLLDFSKVEAGKLDLHRADFAVLDLREELVRLFSKPAEEKGLFFTVEHAPNCPEFLFGDVFRIRQILSNLLSNAIKFTHDGGITLGLGLIERPDAGESIWMRFEVRDTGIGMSAEERKAIFDPFTQADGSTARRYGGTGLGLSICYELVELMGGEIDVNSERGEGSCFVVKLPLRAGTSEALEAHEQERGESIAGAERLQVLVAEDNEVNQLVAVTALQHFGFSPEVAWNGYEALDLVRKGDIDLVLMDIQMPEMDGLEATSRIREWEEAEGLPPIPIIAVTANAFDEDRKRCLEVGMNDFIPKPITLPQLRDSITRLLPARKRGKPPVLELV